MLRPPEGADRERILAMGAFGSGKTKAWLDIAWWSQKTNSPAKFYAIDTDSAVRRMLHGDRYRELTNVELFEVFEWDEYKRALREIGAKVTADDWTIVDFIGTSWDAVQEWYVDQIYGTDPASFFMDARKNMQAGNALDGWRDWSLINREHRQWMNALVHRMPGHKFMTAVAEPLRDTDDKSVKATFGAFGVRPKGQKHLGHQVHTIVLLQTMRKGEWYMSSVKDRERVQHEGTQLTTDFVRAYLVPTAGWKL